MDAKSIDRFWSKVKKAGPDECWEWQAGLNSAGYGAFWYDGSGRRAHRLSYVMAHGDIGDLCVCHRCDNRLCVNPAHLFLGTRQDNNRDRTNKGRTKGPKGERAPSAKLTGEQVQEIRNRYAAGGVSQYQLADQYGVQQSTVGAITRGKNWTHI